MNDGSGNNYFGYNATSILLDMLESFETNSLLSSNNDNTLDSSGITLDSNSNVLDSSNIIIFNETIGSDDSSSNSTQHIINTTSPINSQMGNHYDLPPPPVPILRRYPRQSNFSRGDFIQSLRTLFPNSQQNNLNDVLNSSFNDPNQDVYKNIISDDGKKEIKEIKYNKEIYKEQPTCMITLSDFTDNEDIALLPCNHIFKKEAIFNWLEKEKAQCPICRHKLKSVEVKKEIKEDTTNTNVRLTPNNIIQNIINNQIQQEEERELQDAIMASLRDNN